MLDERTCDNCEHGPLRDMREIAEECLDKPDGPDSPCLFCMRAQPYADNWHPQSTVDSEHSQAIEKAYDIICAILQKQNGVVPFVDCYGDGTRFPLLKREAVGIVWSEMVDMLVSGRDAIMIKGGQI